MIDVKFCNPLNLKTTLYDLNIISNGMSTITEIKLKIKKLFEIEKSCAPSKLRDSQMLNIQMNTSSINTTAFFFHLGIKSKTARICPNL